jgi:hypothetical protein
VPRNNLRRLKCNGERDMTPLLLISVEPNIG